MILLYEDGLFPEQSKEIRIAEQYGFSPIVCNGKTFYNDLPSEDFIFRGSVNTLKHLELIDHPYYNRLTSLNSYSCNYYYPKLFNLLLNKDCLFIPANMVLQSKEVILNAFPETDTLFVRPNYGDKSFTGQRIGKKTFDKEWSAILDQVSRPLFSDEYVLFSSSKEMDAEYRVVVGPNGYITHSEYTDNDLLYADEHIKDSINSMLENLQTVLLSIDNFFVIDYSAKHNKIIEINSFSCSGFYNCNLDYIYSSLQEFFES